MEKLFHELGAGMKPNNIVENKEERSQSFIDNLHIEQARIVVFPDLKQGRYCKSSWSPAFCEFLGIKCKYFSFNRPKKGNIKDRWKMSDIVGNFRKMSETVRNCWGDLWGGPYPPP